MAGKKLKNSNNKYNHDDKYYIIYLEIEILDIKEIKVTNREKSSLKI